MNRSLKHLFGPFGMGTAAVCGICSGAVAGVANGAMTESIVAGVLLAGGVMAFSGRVADGRYALAAAVTEAQRQLVERHPPQMRGPSL